MLLQGYLFKILSLFSLCTTPETDKCMNIINSTLGWFDIRMDSYALGKLSQQAQAGSPYTPMFCHKNLKGYPRSSARAVSPVAPLESCKQGMTFFPIYALPV